MSVKQWGFLKHWKAIDIQVGSLGAVTTVTQSLGIYH